MLKKANKYVKIYSGGDILFVIKLAEINIGIISNYASVKSFCKEYLSDSDVCDFTVSVSDVDKALEKALDPSHSDAYIESICIYRNLCKKLPEYGAFMLHASVVECDGEAFAFCAPSGTGKSTHTSLWLKHFGDRARIINGDKPIIRFIDGKPYVFGTPWCGKEGYNINARAPLTALCFLERGKINRAYRIDPSDAVTKIFPQILLPNEEGTADKLFPLLDQTLLTVPSFRLSCNISDEAVTVAYNTMKGIHKK